MFGRQVKGVVVETRQLGDLWPVSALTLGGGGIGQLWGETTRQECVATTRAAVDAGITLLDMAYVYGDGEAESVVGEAFDGRLPDGVRVTTKCRLGSPPAADTEAILFKSLEDSLRRLRLDRVDVFFLHSNIIADDYDASPYRDRPPTRWSIYANPFCTACEKMIEKGMIGTWGITGIGVPDQIVDALDGEPGPDVVQCIANLIDSAGELQYFPGPTRARELIRHAKEKGIGVMGIRAVQGGALTGVIDRPLPADHGVMADFNRMKGYRALAAEIGQDPADLAHRYALTMAGVDTVVLGVKNRQELAQCVAAEAAGPLDAETLSKIDDVVR